MTYSILPEGKTHRALYADMLRLAFAGPHEKKELIENSIPKTLGCTYDGKKTSVKELLLSTSIESTSLLQTEVSNVFIEGAEPYKQARNAVKVIPMKSKVMQINVGKAGTFAPWVAEGAEIPIANEDPTPVTFTAKKKAVRPLITQELVNDAEFDVIAMAASYAGASLENGLNRAVVDELLGTCAATATLCTDFGNAGATPLTHLDEALTTIKNSGYLPDRVLFHPSCTSAYRLAMQGLNFDVNKGVMETTGVSGKLHGLDVFETGVSDDTATYVWGWGTDNYLGGAVFDSNAGIAIGMREDINVDQYKDPIRDLVGMKAAMRFDVQCLANTACNLLQY